MDSADKNSIKTKTSDLSRGTGADLAVRSTVSNKFDLSILGKIDLIEAEKIASEEVLFLTEADLIDGLEDFELVPVKNYKQYQDSRIPGKEEVSPIILENFDDNNIELSPQLLKEEFFEESVDLNLNENKNDVIESETIKDDQSIKIEFSDLEIVDSSVNLISDEKLPDAALSEEINMNIVEDIVYLDTTDLISEITDDITDAKKLFSIKINEETLDAQLASILREDSFNKIDDKALEKYSELETQKKCRFADDQFLKRVFQDDSISYNEDPLTERLVKMIEVADGKMELLEVAAKEGKFFNYILEDYTLYNSEKFDTVFKEEVFYIDSDFEFIENAIIRDDFTKYIHEIDDYFESEDSLAQSEISEILGLIPDENEYIEDKLFGDYYKKFDLDNEIDFIKPEIDFFRINYTGSKNLNYFTENPEGFSDLEKMSIEEDISSANAIVFEENISEIEEILLNNFNFKPELINEVKPLIEEEHPEEITDITDKIIILEDKESIFELASEFPDKHENLIKLLSYLDGLFEKLPEEVIRKFAESEYFELYSKVLKEIGV